MSKFNKLCNLLLEDYSDDYFGIPANAQAIRIGELGRKMYPEIGDMIQVQASTNLDATVPAEDVKRDQVFMTYVVKDVAKNGTCTMNWCDKIQGVEIENPENPAADLDGTYQADAHPKLIDTTLKVNFKDFDSKALNYSHDNIWTCCLIDQFKKTKPATK